MSRAFSSRIHHSKADAGLVCWFENQTILTKIGYVDGAATPFYLPIPQHGSRRFYYQCNPIAVDKSTDSCFPFHAACWTLLQKSHGRKLANDEIQVLLSIFESVHCHRRSLRWGHNYHVEDLLVDCSTQHNQGSDRENAIAISHINTALLADPLCVSLPEDPAWEQLQWRARSVSSSLLLRSSIMPLGRALGPLVATTIMTFSMRSCVYRRKLF